MNNDKMHPSCGGALFTLYKVSRRSRVILGDYPTGPTAMKIEHKKLPAGWSYVITLCRLKTILRETSADVRMVEFDGAQKSIYGDSWFAARFDSRAINEELVFRLTFSGVPNDIVDLLAESPECMAVEAVQDFLAHFNDKIGSTTSPRVAYIHITRKDDKVAANYSWRHTDKRDLPMISWW